MQEIVIYNKDDGLCSILCPYFNWGLDYPRGKLSTYCKKYKCVLNKYNRCAKCIADGVVLK